MVSISFSSHPSWQSGRVDDRRARPSCSYRLWRYGREKNRVPVLGCQLHIGPESAHHRRQRVMTSRLVKWQHVEIVLIDSFPFCFFHPTDGDLKCRAVKWWSILLNRPTVLQTADGFHEPVRSTKISHSLVKIRHVTTAWSRIILNRFFLFLWLQKSQSHIEDRLFTRSLAYLTTDRTGTSTITWQQFHLFLQLFFFLSVWNMTLGWIAAIKALS